MRYLKHIPLLLLIFAIGCSEEAPPTEEPPVVTTEPGATPWIMPVEVNNPDNPSQEDWNDFFYQSFIALNWPANTTGDRGQPDDSKALGAEEGDMPLRAAWTFYKQPGEVFLANGEEPPTQWNDPPPSNVCPAGTPVLTRATKVGTETFTELNQAGFPYLDDDNIIGALVDRNKEFVWYESPFNWSWFDYFIDHKFYGSAGQLAYLAEHEGSLPPPPDGTDSTFIHRLPPFAAQGVVELKASWRVLDPAVDPVDRYYRQQAYIVDQDAEGNIVCEEELMGLVGFHILRLTESTHKTWVWATFEQVDNITTTDDSILPTFNPGPGGDPAPPYDPGGYLIGNSILNPPVPIKPGQPLPPKDDRVVVNVSRSIAIAPDAATANGKYTGQAPIQGTLWQYYELVGTQVPATAQVTSDCAIPGHLSDTAELEPMEGFRVNACDLSNTTMETFVQTTSCITCHAYATSWGDEGLTTPDHYPRNQIFSFLFWKARPAPSQ